MGDIGDKPPWEFEIPSLGRENLADARLFANRWHMIDSIGPKKTTTVVELGVAVGSFSRALIDRYDPDVFYAIDTFRLHEQEYLWGKKSSEVFGGKTHAEYFLDCMAQDRHRIVVCQGDGARELEKLADGSIDLIYVDGSHHYVDVVRDCAVAQKKVRRGGIIIFNDYIIWSHFERMWYGVVPVVNDLVVNQGYKIIGLALHPDMYMDIAVQN